MDDLLKQIGDRLHSRRKQLRFTQEELSERANITAQTVSYAELGKKALLSREHHSPLLCFGNQYRLSSYRKNNK